MLISEIVSIVNEKISTSEIADGDYVSTDNMRPHFGGVDTATAHFQGSVTVFRNSDILLSNIRPYFRKTWFATRSGGCNADVICIRADTTKCCPKYLYYQLTTDNFVNDYLKACKGIKMPRGDINRLLAYDIVLPSLTEQLRIADITRNGGIFHAA